MSINNNGRHERLRRHRSVAGRPHHRGVAVVIVLALISIALAVSYGLLRSQATLVHIPQNANLRSEARQAAISGLTIAMQSMTGSTWGGINSTLVGTLSSEDSYSVTYTPGDPTLATTDPAQPYRVTLLSTGTSTNSEQPSQQVSYRVRAVVRLAPKQLAAQPANWSNMVQYTVYQNSGQLSVNPPGQVQGPVWAQGAIKISQDINMNSTQLKRFLGDENAMRLAGMADCRPLTGLISLVSANTDATTQGLMTTQLGLTLKTISSVSWPSVSVPSQLSTYQIYPNGPVYKVGQVDASLANINLAPDPTTNPLGLFFRGSDVAIGNNVTITGTLICNGGINITGTGVSFQPVGLPALWSTSTPIRLPAVVCNSSFYCGSGIGVTVVGTLLVGNQFTIDQGSQTNTFSLTGHVISKADVQIKKRNEWNLSSLTWGTDYTLFQTQLLLPRPPGIAYFPVWLSGVGLNPNPLLTLKPDPTLFTDQWQDLTAGAIYAIPAGDGGSRWDLMSWTENL